MGEHRRANPAALGEEGRKEKKRQIPIVNGNYAQYYLNIAIPYWRAVNEHSANHTPTRGHKFI